MLGNHSHVLQSFDQVFVTRDLGLSWEALNAPQPVQTVWTASDGNLLATTASGILLWDYASRSWSEALPLPDGQQVDMLRNLNDTLFALAGGKLYRQAGRAWNLVNMPDANAGTLSAIDTQYPGTFWALDGNGRLLWSTTDGNNWTRIAVDISAT
jgi:hypothetical protein